MTSIRRSLIAVLSLLTLVPLAIFASSYRYLEVYQGSRPSQLISTQAGVANYRSAYFLAGQLHDRVISVQFDGARVQSQWNGLRPAGGGKMWVFDFKFSADPQMWAEGCEIRVLDAEGKQYRMRAATEADPTAGPINYHPCVPADSPGPTLDFGADQLSPSPVPRPESWVASLGVVLPAQVSPAQVQIMWDPPAYAQFEVSPKP